MRLSEVEDYIYTSDDLYTKEIAEEFEESRFVLFNVSIVIKELNIVVKMGFCEHKREFGYISDFNLYMIFKDGKEDYDYWQTGTLFSVVNNYRFYSHFNFDGDINELECEVYYD